MLPTVGDSPGFITPSTDQQIVNIVYIDPIDEV